MDAKEKLKKLAFVKRQMIEEDLNGLSGIQPFISQVFKDVFGLSNELANRVYLISNGFILNRSDYKSENDYLKAVFESYMKLLKQAVAYISLEDNSEYDLYSVKSEKSKSPSIFLSYSWSDTDKANRIDDFLQEKGIKIIRDVRDVEDWQSLKEFMETIRENDYAVLLISDSYLKSENCMYEVLEVMKEAKYKKKIYPAIIDMDIYSSDEQIKYIQFWEDKKLMLKKNLSSLEYTNGLALGARLKKIEDISRTIGEFLVVISDMKNPNIENINDAIYSKIRSLL